jgi:hypothetical protein
MTLTAYLRHVHGIGIWVGAGIKLSLFKLAINIYIAYIK